MRNTTRLLCNLVFGLALTSVGCNKLLEDAVKSGFEQARQEEANKAKKLDAAAEVTATPEEVAKAYNENQLAADQKYKGKVVQMAGTVSNIATNFSDQPVVNLASGMFGADVACHLVPGDLAKAAELRKEQKITVKGVGEGMLFGPSFDPCTIVETGPAPGGEQPAEGKTTP
jgi:hypothetical protein